VEAIRLPGQQPDAGNRSQNPTQERHRPSPQTRAPRGCKDPQANQHVQERHTDHYLKTVQKWDEHERADDPSCHCAHGFIHVDPAGNGIIRLTVHGIDAAAKGKQCTVQHADRQQDQERGVAHRQRPDVLPDGHTQHDLEDSDRENGGKKRRGEQDGHQGEGLKLVFGPVNHPPRIKTAQRLEQQPVGQDDADTQLVPGKYDEQLSQQEDLSNQPAEAHDDNGCANANVHDIQVYWSGPGSYHRTATPGGACSRTGTGSCLLKIMVAKSLQGVNMKRITTCSGKEKAMWCQGNGPGGMKAS
jgi:hypothetical protein